ncbi:hypothetical protein CLAIMM_08321 [Cladophialophora immunda]|nr:hypothetical protein CLAIMM_08321 [Cladophialophora immunda]
MDTPGDQSGFSPHVWNRLNEMAQQSAPRARGGRRRGQGQGQTRAAWRHQDQEEQLRPESQQPASSFTVNYDSFPPLGSQPPPRGRSNATYPLRSQHPPDPQAQNFPVARHGTPREYQERARGNYRGSRGSGVPQRQPQHHFHSEHQPQFMNPAAFHTNGRPPTHPHRQLYNPNDTMHFGAAQQQRSMTHLVSMQADYLTSVGRRAYEAHKFGQEERDVKENFRRTLESIARRALGAEYPNLKQDNVRLRCYGSLANGFALAGSDMDLLLSLPNLEGPETEVNMKPTSDAKIASDDQEDEQAFKTDTGRVLEKAFLDHEYGARLITKTRVPILRICQNPTPELLSNLRENRAAWEESHRERVVVESGPPTSDEPPPELDSVGQALNDLNLGETAPAKKGRRGNEGLEFTEDCGIQCDINFSNFVALHNSAMLRIYQGFDPRVREIGVFVKIWAKTRDINTPYRGTLSSYGWILMVLHYLMNVAKPPVIPNLQYLAKIDDSWHPERAIELFEGFDIRFVQDPQSLKEIREDMAANLNKEPVGQLLRGFFQYYATYQGFHWTRDVISIRTKGGLISKQAKGWTEAKWQQTQTKSVRLRYLLAIEDPFEIEHNVARTVGHHGIIAIRDEFRRVWSIINTVGTDQAIPVEEFLTPVTERVDTLRKDLEARKERQMQMRQELEAKEKALLRKRDEEFPDPLTDGQEPAIEATDLATEKEEQESIGSAAPSIKAEPKDLFTCVSDVLLANGYDHAGNPVAWDIDTQDGRWLHWRDVKARKGTLRSFSNPMLRKLDEECPYDPRRPDPYIGKPYRNQREKLGYQQAPWPSGSRNGGIKSMVASVRPHFVEDKVTAPRMESGVGPQGVPEADVKAEAGELYEADTHEKSKAASPENADNKATYQDPAGQVGVNILWDRNTIGGRWLRRRDAPIRGGTAEHHPVSRCAEIDLAFPYKPEMTWKEREAMNQQLRQHYKHSIFTSKQRNPMSRRVATETLNTEVNDRARPSGPAETAASAMQTNTQKSAQDMEEAANDLSSAHIDTLPSKPLPPESRPSPDSISERVPLTPPGGSRIPNLDFLRTQRLAFFSKLPSSLKSGVDTNVELYTGPAVASEAHALVNEQFRTPIPASHIPNEEVCVVGDSHRLKAKAFSGKADTQSHYADESSAVMESEETQGTENSSLEVPATLYPHLDSSRRPRDEDPNILPIPLHPGFCFDPRQLEDIAVILRGGNGCARDGAQYHIEEEYEWGGGGMMGWKTSTGPQLAGMSGGHTPYEAGSGDEQGLLAELPRDLV